MAAKEKGAAAKGEEKGRTGRSRRVVKGRVRIGRREGDASRAREGREAEGEGEWRERESCDGACEMAIIKWAREKALRTPWGMWVRRRLSCICGSRTSGDW